MLISCCFVYFSFSYSSVIMTPALVCGDQCTFTHTHYSLLTAISSDACLPPRGKGPKPILAHVTDAVALSAHSDTPDPSHNGPFSTLPTTKISSLHLSRDTGVVHACAVRGREAIHCQINRTDSLWGSIYHGEHETHRPRWVFTQTLESATPPPSISRIMISITRRLDPNIPSPRSSDIL